MSVDSEPDRQRQLAEERTEVAYQRTWLAEVRTFSAWLRTGLASLATGLAIAKLMAEAGPTWLMRALGALFVVVGGAIFCLALVAYRNAMRELRTPPAHGIPMGVIVGVSVVLLVGAATALVIVFVD